MMFDSYRMPWPLKLASKLYAISSQLNEHRGELTTVKDVRMIDNTIAVINEMGTRLETLLIDTKERGDNE